MTTFFTKLLSVVAIVLLLSSCIGNEVDSVEDNVEMKVSKNGDEISNLSDTYIFGVISVNSSADATFSIENQGEKVLKIYEVEILGDDAEQFSVVKEPAFYLETDESTTFTIRFSPSSSGSKVAAATIYTNDRDALPFAFGVSGLTNLLSFIDGDGTDGVNKDTTEAASNIHLNVLSDKVYATWQETNAGGINQIRVAVWDGTSTWSFVDGNGVNGLNVNALEEAITPKLVTFGGEMFLTWNEEDTGVSQIRCYLYNGNDLAPAWSAMDGGAATGLNKDTLKNAFNPSFNELDSKLYLTWHEVGTTQNQIRVAVFNGNTGAPAWSMVDGNGVDGLNKDTTREASNAKLTTQLGKQYITWQESNGTNTQIRMAVYNGNDASPSWSFVDGNGANGINFSTTQDAQTPQIISYATKLYATWQESNGTNTQIRAAVYNSNDSSPSWSFVDGNLTTGLNASTTENATTPIFLVSTSLLQLYWTEANSGVTQIRGKLYNAVDSAPEWVSLDGGASTGVNKDTAKNASSPHVVDLNDTVHIGWHEVGTTVNQIRIGRSSGFDS